MEEKRDTPERGCLLIADNESLQERLIQFAVKILGVARALPSNPIHGHIALQMVRAATSATANYAEARSAESRADFIHKLRLALKELRETDVWLRIIAQGKLLQYADVSSVIEECYQLTAIFVAAINIARHNALAPKP